MNQSPKHPAYRINDFLRMDREWLQKAIDYARGVLDFIPMEVSCGNRSGNLVTISREGHKLRLEGVGSYTRGIAGLHSDMDFNLSFEECDFGGEFGGQKVADWVRQNYFRRWFYGNKQQIVDYLAQFEKDYGLRIDVGFVDPETWSYNTYLDTDELKLYHRGKLLDNFETGRIPQALSYTADQSPIDLNNLPAQLPPAVFEKPRFDNFCLRWVASPSWMFAPKGGWTTDAWTDEIEKWRERYGEYFVSYHSVPEGDGLKLGEHFDAPTNPGVCVVCKQPCPQR